MSTIPEIMKREGCGYREARRIQDGSSANPPPESREATVRVGTGELVGAPRRPSKRDQWTRAYVCAVATHWLQHEDIVSASDLLRTAGTHDNILKHADEEDIATLRSAGLLCPNNRHVPTPESGGEISPK